ncbi:uncharacterized protein BXZ73DRAFT_96391 [Epithele typhae]|uniref:uncharacterized protein n=1 Tax=Epithele typhae TaxID=378194 RepID=UPI002007B5B9|nr:uncharacterized protein BXZ73DRAFT_96391 [Epithele typhae]KAH9945400.1 hypothetical protein BXZ73DRAFT_96391 [Epithele typhae]
MASVVDPAYVALATEYYSEGMVSAYCTVAGCVFFLWEAVLNLGREVDLFWQRPTSGASVLYFANKYIFLLYSILNLVTFDTSLTNNLYVISSYMVWGTFSSLRALALTRSLILAVGILLLALVPVGINAVRYGFDFNAANDPILGCVFGNTLPSNLPPISSLITVDFTLIGVTWWKIYAQARWSKVILARPTLSTVLLRDGTIYFIILLIMNALHMTFTLTTLSQEGTNIVSNLGIFTDPVTAVLVSRFLLNLQEVNQRSAHICTDSRLHDELEGTDPHAPGSTLNFVRVVGSLSSSLEPDDVIGFGSASYDDTDTDVSRGLKEDWKWKEQGLATLADIQSPTESALRPRLCASGKACWWCTSIRDHNGEPAVKITSTSTPDSAAHTPSEDTLVASLLPTLLSLGLPDSLPRPPKWPAPLLQPGETAKYIHPLRARGWATDVRLLVGKTDSAGRPASAPALTKRFRFADRTQLRAFVDALGRLEAEENHHVERDGAGPRGDQDHFDVTVCTHYARRPPAFRGEPAKDRMTAGLTMRDARFAILLEAIEARILAG